MGDTYEARSYLSVDDEHKSDSDQLAFLDLNDKKKPGRVAEITSKYTERIITQFHTEFFNPMTKAKANSSKARLFDRLTNEKIEVTIHKIVKILSEKEDLDKSW